MNVMVYGVYTNSGFYKHGTNGWVHVSNMIKGTRKSIYAMSRAELLDIEKEIKLLVTNPDMPEEAGYSLRECYELAKLRRMCEDVYESMCQKAEEVGVVIFKDTEDKMLGYANTIDTRYRNNCDKVI